MQMGLDPIHFGIILTFSLSIGVITPPVGSVLFVGCSIVGLQIEDVLKTLIKIFILLVIALLLVAFIPQLSLFIPELFDL
jgi:TRAP-type C4-dicarboxylate transport system permease large subunit